MNALRRITPRTYLLAFLGNAALLFLGWLWLYIPDAHTWQFIFTIILAAAILAAFLALHATIIRRLYPGSHSGSELRLWQSALILLGWLLIAHVLQHTVSLLDKNVDTRAGYWNSQLSAHHRVFWTYTRLVDWQNTAIDLLLWIVIPALLLPFAVETMTRTQRPGRTAFATLRKPQLWLTVAFAYLVGSWLGDHILAWHPLHSVSGELISVALRTVFVYAFVIALLLITLAVVSELLAREHARRNPTP